MIRPAVTADKGRVVDLLRASRAGAEFDRHDGMTGFVFPFVPEFAERIFSRYQRGPGTFCSVYDVDGVAQGILMAHAFEHDFGPVRLAQERVWWIDPAHRGGTAAFRMLEAYEAWAAREGCQYIGMAGMGDDPVVMALYQRRGYRRAETHCLKAI